MDPLITSMKVAASGLHAQSERLRIVSENMANAQSTGSIPGSDPYQRQTITFAAELDRASGGSFATVANMGTDRAQFPLEYMPGHEAADANGYVKLPNVNMLIEMADMREANRGYDANLQVIRQAREMITMTIDLMRSQ